MLCWSPMPPGPPSSTLFPYTTLFRSEGVLHEEDRPQGAFLDAEIRVSRPRRDDGREGRFPDAVAADAGAGPRNLRGRSEEHTSELQSHRELVCRLLLEKKKFVTIHPR